jgi:hypothetical protein
VPRCSEGFVNGGAEASAAIVLGSCGATGRRGFTIQTAFHVAPEAFALNIGIGLDRYGRGAGVRRTCIDASAGHSGHTRGSATAHLRRPDAFTYAGESIHLCR